MAKKLAEIGNNSYGATYTGGPTTKPTFPTPKAGAKKSTPNQAKKYVGTPKTTPTQSGSMSKKMSNPTPKGKANPALSGSMNKALRDAKPKPKATPTKSSSMIKKEHPHRLG